MTTVYFEWDGILDLGIEEIDKQHRDLVGILNKAYKATLQEDTTTELMTQLLEELMEYAAHHFSTEEELMRSKHFPEIESHKLEHALFNEHVNLTVATWVTLGATQGLNHIMTFIKAWIQTHITTVDIKLRSLA